MLDGWYCRSIANSTNNTEEEDEIDETLKYKIQYKHLKRKLKYLIYENECFQDSLRSAQQRLLTVNKDRSFLLDRLLQYEKINVSSSESEDTESSDDPDLVKNDLKRRKTESIHLNHGNGIPVNKGGGGGQSSSVKKKRPTLPKLVQQTKQQQQPPPVPLPVQLQTMNKLSSGGTSNMISDGHMTPEEVERHLQSRQSYMELVPEKAPPTVPTEMFSNDPSLDSESNDLETSPSNMGEDLSIDMIAE